MKTTVLLLAIFLIPFSGYSQFEYKGITVDGSVNHRELNDTTQWNTVVREPDVIIRESDTGFYIAIMSNTYTSVNLYIDQRPETIKVLHASYSLGIATYKKTYKGQWSVIDGVADEESGKKVYNWKFRDPIIRDVSATINLPTEMETFYTENQWISNTMPMGSYREVEFLLSKDLVSDFGKIFLTYLKKDLDDKTVLIYFPNTTKTIAGNEELDKELQSGYLLKISHFEFRK